jgi:hypothetical protein
VRRDNQAESLVGSNDIECSLCHKKDIDGQIMNNVVSQFGLCMGKIKNKNQTQNEIYYTEYIAI